MIKNDIMYYNISVLYMICVYLRNVKKRRKQMNSEFEPQSIPTAPLIQCRGLTKVYPGGVAALNNLSVEIYRGRTVGLLGPNGSGKTTFLKMAAGLLTPTFGEILINGMQPCVETKKIVSYLPDKSYLNNWMTVENIVSYFSDFYDNFSAEKAYEMLSRLGIGPKQKLKTMSKGTKEKVQLILVMSRDADVYLLDEPIGGVDPAARDYILDTIMTARRPDSVLMISTHLIYDIERILDDVMFISGGQVFLAGEANALRKHYEATIDEIFRKEFRC